MGSAPPPMPYEKVPLPASGAYIAVVGPCMKPPFPKIERKGELVVVELPYALVQASIYRKTPIWWRWYCWICPAAWTLYGLVSQYGDITTPMEDGRTVNVFIEDYFDFKHSWLGWAAAIVVAFSVFFAALFAFAIMKLNFEKR
ncbi:unnamed protein product [Miscanthus lutarioriparius]|uniref:Uncharacterized protein n=1 Tax=Miscanthus lutarioriparius TaxID=422564 RepID=A0A811S5G6_9POAL|nr:unnamed protein product [Miscanthus lutarioriparius]